MKKDVLAFVLIRVQHIMEAFIPCRNDVEHLPRIFNIVATIYDNLSSKSTTTLADLPTSLTMKTTCLPHFYNG
jgi:hypothetical protein